MPGSIPIERAHGLTPDRFRDRCLIGTGTPIVVTDALESWAAPSRWSFDLFRTRYGSESVVVKTGRGTGRRKKLMRLGEYLDYLDAPEEPSPGLWIDAETLHPALPPAVPPAAPLYLPWNAFRPHPELLEDVELSPGFVEDWLPLLPGALRTVLDEATKYFHAGLMIGPAGAQLGLHYDFLDTHAYLAQVVGRKRCVLFSPDDAAAISNDQGRVDPDSPDHGRFPRFREATPYECTLEPGELLFIPWRWWHHAVALEKSITVNYNFFNSVNVTTYLTHLLQVLPAVVEGLEQSAEARAALGIEWTSRGFDK